MDTGAALALQGESAGAASGQGSGQPCLENQHEEQELFVLYLNKQMLLGEGLETPQQGTLQD